MRLTFNPRLYLVLDPRLCGNEKGMLQTALYAAEGGATMVQLRAPGWGRERLIDCAMALKIALTGTSTRLIINNDPHVCIAVNADGVHVGQSDMHPAKVRQLIGPERLIGLSITAFKDLNPALFPYVDYLGVGPVFPTTTKKDATKAMGLREFNRIAKASTLPVVAIGGIDERNARSTLENGAAGVAVVSAICGTKEPALSAKKLLDAMAPL